MFVRGFTLLEVMIVVLLVAVLAGLAVPAWRQHLVRVHRSEAITGLAEIAAAEERFYISQGRYADELAAAPPAGLGLTPGANARRYSFSVAVAEDGQSFVASATPTRAGGQDSDVECLAFSIDHRGRRAVNGSREPTFCWR
jgi:type IV pilus assembly protein PilE